MAASRESSIRAWLALRVAADDASKAANEAKRALEAELRLNPDLPIGALLLDEPTQTIWWRQILKSENVTLTLLKEELAEEMALQIWARRRCTDQPCLVVDRKVAPRPTSGPQETSEPTSSGSPAAATGATLASAGTSGVGSASEDGEGGRAKKKAKRAASKAPASADAPA